MDMVVNHTSTAQPVPAGVTGSGSPYRDYYSWRDPSQVAHRTTASQIGHAPGSRIRIRQYYLQPVFLE
jgi:glycosidase